MNTFSIIVFSALIISGIYKAYVNRGSEKIKKEDFERIKEDKKGNVTLFVIKLIFTLIFGIGLLYFLSSATSAISSPLNSLSLLDILKLIIAIIFGYFLYKVWFSKDEY